MTCTQKVRLWHIRDKYKVILFVVPGTDITLPFEATDDEGKEASFIVHNPANWTVLDD